MELEVRGRIEVKRGGKTCPGKRAYPRCVDDQETETFDHHDTEQLEDGNLPVVKK